MKPIVKAMITAVCVLSSAGLGMLGGCSAPENFLRAECDPNAFEPDPWCRVANDAGTDAESDTSSLKEEPGLDTSKWAPPESCKTGHCVPVPVGVEAGLWQTIPISLWIGPIDQVPAKCPDDPVVGVPNEQFRLFDQLVAPAATCSPCACAASEGTCSGVPETLELRAGTCAQNGAMTTPFDGPADWNGSCSNADQIAAGAKCPTGSQTLCVQSVHSSALPVPTNDECKPSMSAPSSNLKTSWEIGALACHANTQNQTCGTATLSAYCVNNPGPDWLQCTYRNGVHEKCPDNYQYARHVLYPEKPIDDRGCSACACGTPMESACIGALSLSGDNECTAEHVKLQVVSTGDICYDFAAPGIGISSKAIVNRTYLPGICAASGGEPMGKAAPDAKNAVTFCCSDPYDKLGPKG